MESTEKLQKELDVLEARIRGAYDELSHNNVPQEERIELRKQIDAMEAYADSLRKRIEISKKV